MTQQFHTPRGGVFLIQVILSIMAATTTLAIKKSAFAEFSFTGVGVYFLSPLWPYSVGAQLILDGQSPPILVDLRDYSMPFSADGGSETVSSRVVWGVQNLTAGNHTLRIEFAQGQAQYVVLDALSYTSVESNSNPPPSTTPSTSTTSPAAPMASPSQPSTPTLAQASPTPSPSSSSSSPVVAGVVVGVVLALVGLGLVFCYVRYRRRIVARFPRLFGIRDEELGYPTLSAVSRGSALNSPNPLPNPPTDSRRSHSGLVPNPFPSTSTSTLSTPLLSRRTPLPSEATQKDLPDLPPEPIPKTPQHARRPSFFSSKRGTVSVAPVVPVNTEPKRSQSGASSSATSSFFPSPIHEEDIALSPRTKSGAKRSSTAQRTEESRTEEMTRLGIQTTVSERPREEPRSFALFSPNYTLNQTVSSTAGTLPSVSPKTSRILTNVPVRASSKFDTPVNLPSASPQSLAPRKRVPAALDIIPEGSSPARGSPAASSDRSSTKAKRRSEGRIRLEKDRKQRRRYTRTISSPHGPRPPSSATRLLSPLPSAVATPNTSAPLFSDVSRPPTPKTPRRRRPLPASPLGPRRPSLSRGPHILVPLNITSRSSIPILPRSPEVIAILQSRGLMVNVDERTNADPTAIDSRDRNLPPLLSLFPSPPLPSPPRSAPDHNKKSASPPTLNTPTTSLRPRSGQPEYVKSLPAVLSATDVPSHMPSSSISRGPLPTVPHSAPPHSAPSYPPSIASSPRSPRRLPPAPLRNIQSNKLTSVNPGKDLMGGSDTSTEQYVIVPPYPNAEPPPYSGRRYAEPEISAPPKPALGHAATSSPSPAVRRVLAGPSRQPPRSVPLTPTENSWMSNSTKMLATMKASEGSVDSTAANMLIDMLNDAASNESHSSAFKSVRPLSVRRASSLNSTAIPNDVPRRESVATRSNSLASVSASVPAAPLIITLPTRPATSGQDRTSTKPPPSPSTSSLSIPPQPSSPPPPVPAISPRQRRRGKVWNAEGVNVRVRPSGGSSSSHQTGSG